VLHAQKRRLATTSWFYEPYVSFSQLFFWGKADFFRLALLLRPFLSRAGQKSPALLKKGLAPS
jgi:hypothetical protein